MTGKKAPFLCAAFFFTFGAAALMYEVVWVRLLGLVFGNTTFAVSTVLSAYMAGLGFGSFYFGRLADRWQKTVRAYALLEIGIGIYAAFTPLILSLLTSSYIHTAKALQANFAGLTTIRLFFSFFIVFVPTFFMGGTLPVLAKFFERQKAAAGAHIAFLYGLNTIGAVAGTALAGFWFLPVLGLKLTVCVAVILNIGIGFMALALSAEVDPEGKASASKAAKVKTRRGGNIEEKFLFAALFAAGVIAMIYEVCWTRTLATVLSSSAYAFTLMLVTFLLGFGLGSMAWKRVLASREATFLDFAKLTAGIAFFSLLALPIFPWVTLLIVRLHALTIGNYTLFQMAIFLVCGALMMPPAFLFGGLFPVSTDLYSRRSADFGSRIGLLYLTNTAGNVVGSLTAGFLLIPAMGIYKTVCAASLVAALLALLMAWRHKDKQVVRPAVIGGSLILAFVSMAAMPIGWDKSLVTSGINLRPAPYLSEKASGILSRIHDVQVLFYREGLHSIVSVGQYGDDRHIKVNGKADASTKSDMPTQLLLAHLPHILHPAPKRSLVIGFGSGTTLAAALTYPVDQVDCVEIEPAVLEAAPYFDSVNRKTYLDPRAKLIVNDGRNHLLLNEKPYDIIISEPSNPWMAGVSNLFTADFYRLAAKNLAQGGIFCQWVQSYGIAPEDFQMIVASLKEAFPHVTLWHSTSGDYLLLASQMPLAFDYALAEGYMKRPQVRNDFASFGVETPAGLLAHFCLGEKDLARFSEGALINTDDKLLLEFHTPRTLYEATAPIIREILENIRTEFMPSITGLAGQLSSQPQMLAEIGGVYLGMEKPKEARRFFELALKADASNAKALVGMGRIAGNDKKWTLANGYFSRVKCAEGLAYWGWTLHLAGDNAEAFKKLAEATSLPDTKWEHFFWYAQALAESGDKKAALEALKKALDLEPNNLTIQLAYGKALAAADAKESAAYLEALREKYPTFYPIYSDLRDAYGAAGDLNSAIGIYKSYLKNNPYSVNAWLNLQRLYGRAGDQAHSDKAGERAYALDPFGE